jgi:CheY-like chemotaxis protein
MDNSREVMIVEDDECTRSLLAALVAYYGFRPEPVSDGTAALARLKGATSGLVVLDLFLPHTNGFEVLRELKSTQPEVLRRTIVLTAASSRTTAGCIELNQVWKVLKKPVDVLEFVQELQACCAASLAEHTRPSADARKARAGAQQERDTH